MRSFGKALTALVVLGAALADAGLLVRAWRRMRRCSSPRPRGASASCAASLISRRNGALSPPGEATALLLGRVTNDGGHVRRFARQYPQSDHSDDALWQAAVLSADAFWQFGDSRDRTAALRLFGLLRVRYPSSSLVAQLAGHTARLNGAESIGARATLKAIRRDVLSDALRITLEFEREAVFHDQRVDGPPSACSSTC